MPDIANQKSAEWKRHYAQLPTMVAIPFVRPKSISLPNANTMKNLELYEPVEFIMKFLVDKLIFTPIDETITVHATCSTIKMDLKDSLIQLAKLCSNNVVVPEEVGCCGFAGDKGLHPKSINLPCENCVRK